MVADPVVVVRREGGVAEIVLSRPDKLNAMNLAWVQDMDRAVAAVVDDPPEIVVVRGEGRAFCTGLDLDMLGAEGMPPGFFPLQERAFRALEELDRIVIALIHGYCLGGGLQLALACDLRVVSEDAVLALPAALEGLPAGMAPWRLPRFVGLGRAMRLAVGGDRIDAGEALALGLADHVVPSDQFAEHAAAVVARYQAVPQLAARATKALARSAFDVGFDAACARAHELIERCLADPSAAAARATWAHRRG
jgi:enoyl-CoA hydratase